MRLQAVVVRVMLVRDGRVVGVRMHGRDADGSRVDVNGFACRTILAELDCAGTRGRAASGLCKALRAVGFSDPGRALAFAMDRFIRDGVRLRCVGNGRGSVTYFGPETAA